MSRTAKAPRAAKAPKATKAPKAAKVPKAAKAPKAPRGNAQALVRRAREAASPEEFTEIAKLADAIAQRARLLARPARPDAAMVTAVLQGLSLAELKRLQQDLGVRSGGKKDDRIAAIAGRLVRDWHALDPGEAFRSAFLLSPLAIQVLAQELRLKGTSDEDLRWELWRRMKRRTQRIERARQLADAKESPKPAESLQDLLSAKLPKMGKRQREEFGRYAGEMERVLWALESLAKNTNNAGEACAILAEPDAAQVAEELGIDQQAVTLGKRLCGGGER